MVKVQKKATLHPLGLPVTPKTTYLVLILTIITAFALAKPQKPPCCYVLFMLKTLSLRPL